MLPTSHWITTQLTTPWFCLRTTPRCPSQTLPRVTSTTLSASPITARCWASSASREASTTGRWSCSTTASVASASATAAWSGRAPRAAWAGTASPGASSGSTPKYHPGTMTLKSACPSQRLPRLGCYSTVTGAL